MSLEELFKNKDTKPKEKTEMISAWILDNSLSIDELIGFADKGKDPIKATCIEAMEFASKNKPSIIDEIAFDFVTETLSAKAPRIKWESAKVIGNVASLFPAKLEKSIANLLLNATHEGTVVRWSAAYALGEIIKLSTKHNSILLPKVNQIIENEEKNSIKKIYQAALKKIKAK
jgi:HEAT repeat protein